MGKIAIIFILLICAITSSILTGVNKRSEEIPKMLNGNFQDIGSYALQYGMNQVLTGQITDNTNTNFEIGNNDFEVLDGRINSISYSFKSTTTSADYLEDNPFGEGEDDDGVFVYDIITNGDLNINPGTSDNNEFQMETPTEGYEYIDRTQIHNNAPELEYSGPASVVRVKPKAQGRTLIINGVEFELNTNARYTITSNNMTVHLYNDKIKNGKAMGHWWISINAVDAILELDPGIPLEDFVEDISYYAQETFTHLEVEIMANVSMEVQGKILNHDSRAGAVVLVAENEDVFWWTSNEEDSSYKIVYWNP